MESAPKNFVIYIHGWQLRNDAGRDFVAYEISVARNGQEWTVYRRFKQFDLLRKELSKSEFLRLAMAEGGDREG